MLPNALPRVFISTVIVILHLLTELNTLEVSRRIKDGELVLRPKRYMAYLVKAEISPRHYDHWICGGALITPDSIITSAACVVDIVFSFAIAGYDKYVPYTDLDNDPCTKTNKRRVVFSCVPKAYELEYAEVSKWSNIDIGIVRVDSPYNLEIFYEHCSYAPKLIPVNYDERFQEPGNDVLTYGWGHTSSWRKPKDKRNHNQKTLHYARTVIQPQSLCISKYPDTMEHIIKNYMICTDGLGSINETGMRMYPRTYINGCDPETSGSTAGYEAISKICRKTLIPRGKKVDKPGEGKKKEKDAEGRKRRKNGEEERKNKTNGEEEEPVPRGESEEDLNGPGPCQNDHGGPLVTWIGDQEYLIGVASVFRVTKDWQCTGPYLFTSTHCNSKFIECITNELKFNKESGDYERVKELCSGLPKDKGFDVVKRTFTWEGHPDGPAKQEYLRFGPVNAELKFRPQTSIR